MRSRADKELVTRYGEIRTPPFSEKARIETGFLLRKLQQGENLSLPRSRPMPVIGQRCHELRIPDKNVSWRIIYRIDPDAIIILEVFRKQTQDTPNQIIDLCKKRLGHYNSSFE